MRRLGTSLTILTLAAACWAGVASARAGEAPCYPAKPRPQDQIWLISTRDLGCASCRLTEAPRLAVWKYDPAAKNWQVSTVEKFLATDDPAVPTNVKVHGNWFGFDESVQVAFTYYGYQAALAPSDRPLRLVIWSWPSTRHRRPLRDVRRKYARTDTEALYLAWFVGRIDPRVRVSYVGYSYGAPIVTGALHHLATHGGVLSGQPKPKAERVPGRTVLLAAAECDDVLAVGGQHELALSQIDQMLVLYNCCDPALKWFRWVDKCRWCEALGYSGISGSLGANAAKVKQLETSGTVGGVHYWLPYVSSRSLIEEMRPYIWFDDVFGEKATTQSESEVPELLMK